MSLTLYFKEWVPAHEADVARTNRTHNLNKMAEALGVYQLLWRPEEVKEGMIAKEILPQVVQALDELLANREEYEQYDSPNGWGTTEGMIRFLREVRSACEEYPNSRLEACR